MFSLKLIVMYVVNVLQIFGTYVPPVVSHDAELAQWKAIADAKHAVYLKQQEDIRLAKKAERDREVDRLCNHVRERMAQLQHNQEMEQRQNMYIEEARVKKRKEDRELRRELRFERYLEKEREHMIFEDVRSYKVSYIAPHSVLYLTTVSMFFHQRKTPLQP